MFDLEKGYELLNELKKDNETLREVEYKRYCEFNETFKKLLKHVEEQRNSR